MVLTLKEFWDNRYALEGRDFVHRMDEYIYRGPIEKLFVSSGEMAINFVWLAFTIGEDKKIEQVWERCSNAHPFIFLTGELIIFLRVNGSVEVNLPNNNFSILPPGNSLSSYKVKGLLF